MTTTTLPGEVLQALEEVGVLVFHDLHLDPETQVAFCRKLGLIETNLTASHEVEGVSRVTLGPLEDRDRRTTSSATSGGTSTAARRTRDAYPPMVTDALGADRRGRR